MDNSICIKTKKIESLTGLKVISLLAVFWWHSTLPKPIFNIGARACDFLFVCSGFLMAYNYISRNIVCTWKESFRYFCKKFILFWPLHFLVLTFHLIFLSGISVNNVAKYFIKLFFLQSWSSNRDIYYTMNGPTWFLSSLLVCYFFVPVLIKFVKVNYKSILFFIVAITIRFLWEIVFKYIDVDYLSINFYINPLVRTLDFFIGMLLFPFYSMLKDKLKNKALRSIVFSFLESAVICLSIYFFLKYDEKVISAFYIFFVGLITLVFSFDSGVISKFFSLNIFKILNYVQFEFYIVHITFITCWKMVISFLNKRTGILLNNMISMLLLLIITYVFAYLYKKYFSKRLSDYLKVGVNKICNFFEIDIEL